MFWEKSRSDHPEQLRNGWHVWENIRKGKWGPDSKFDLIKDNRFKDTERVYIEYRSKLRGFLKRLINTKWTLENLEERRILNRRAEQYMIEISSKELAKWRNKLAHVECHDELPPISYCERLGSWIVTREGCEGMYDRITGFLPADLEGGASIDDAFV